jgi:(p)ppGpp synthase/HD superfamily hydrolase
MSANEKYHVNPSTGNTGTCHAATKPCPFGGESGTENHYSSLHEANKAAEEMLTTEYGHNANKGNNNGSTDARELLRKAPQKTVFDVVKTIPSKKMDANLLTAAILSEAHIDSDEDREKISHAIWMSTLLHAGQTRANRGNLPRTPYIEHPLRNTLRIIRWGVKDNDIVVGAILHDCVEDGSQNFARDFLEREDLQEQDARNVLTEYISQEYGAGTADIVTGVSNPHIENDTRTKAQKHVDYRAHVLESIDDDRVFIVKLADYVDNATGLYHNYVDPNKPKVALMAKKYLPLVRPFVAKLKDMRKNNPEIMDDEAFTSVIQQMYSTESRLQKIINEQESK